MSTNETRVLFRFEAIDSHTGKAVDCVTGPARDYVIADLVSAGRVLDYLTVMEVEPVQTDAGPRWQYRNGWLLVSVYPADDVAAELVAEADAALNALGEPMPASDAEALARQLVREIDEAGAMVAEWPARPELRAAYEAKSSRVRAMGYEIGPDGRGGLCLWRGDNTGPVQPQVRHRYLIVWSRVNEPKIGEMCEDVWATSESAARERWEQANPGFTVLHAFRQG